MAAGSGAGVACAGPAAVMDERRTHGAVASGALARDAGLFGSAAPGALGATLMAIASRAVARGAA